MKQIATIIIIIIYAVALATDFYIFTDIRKYTAGIKRKVSITIFGILSLVCIVIYTIGWICNTGFYQNVYLAMWLLFSSLSIIIPEILYVIFSLIGKLVKKFHKNNTESINYFAILGLILSVSLFIYIWWGVFFTRNELEVDSISISDSKIPESFKGYKIVQFSDAHLGSWGNDTTFTSKLVTKINELNPDLIVFTGDIVNRETAELSPFLKVLSKLKAKDGVYSVLGNHDYGDYANWKSKSEKAANMELMKVWQRQIGWKLLNNSHVWLHRGLDSIALIGVENWGEPPFKQYGDLMMAYPDIANNGLNDSYYKILLSHNPSHWDEEVTELSNINLTLSGHTHAMQMEFGIGKHVWSPIEMKYPQWDGLYTKRNSNGERLTLNVNRGCGEIGIPARYGKAKPVITEITLQ